MSGFHLQLFFFIVVAAEALQPQRCVEGGCLPSPPPIVAGGLNVSWSSEEDWVSLNMTKPVAGKNGKVEEWVIIPPGVLMILDENPPPMARLLIYGVLEVSDAMDMTLSAEIVIIQGDSARLVAGTENEPYQHKFDLILMGNHETPEQSLPDGLNLGAKAIGVFGQLDLHGLDVGTTWAHLAQYAYAGNATITLSETVDPTFWKEGAEIIIAPTGFEPSEYEKMTIESVDGNNITLKNSLQFIHLGNEYSLDDGSRSWNLSAEVGLLSRNIRIIGESYAAIGKEEFGARVLVSTFLQDGVEYKGYAKMSSVEFVRAGQEGWYDPSDPRYSLALVNHGNSTDNDENNKESYVKKCTFNYNYNGAIGLFNTSNVLIEDNVIFRTMEYGIRDSGIGNRFINNLVVLNEFIGINKDQRTNFLKHGCFHFSEAVDPEFQNNAAAACLRAGFVGPGQTCSSTKRWANNVIHTVQDGVLTTSGYPALDAMETNECFVLRGFFVYKAYDYAFYLLTQDTVEMDNNIIIDSGVGIHPFLIKPRPTTHETEDKYLRINNTLIVGRNDPSQCDSEPSYAWFDKERNSEKTMWIGRNWKGYATGHAGLLWPIFSGVGVPLGKPWINGGPQSFPLLSGQVYLNNITFANFNPGQCGGQFDSAIRTNPRGDDMQFPIFAQGTKFVNVADSSKIWMDRPIMSLVVNGQCVDMHCDGLKKALLIDLDGDIIGDGTPGTIIADSAYQWDGNPLAGLSYDRVPKTMLPDVSEYETKMPNTGIVRNDQCSWVQEWHAYKCHDIDHRLLVLESMDKDTLDRRLSPVAVLANPGADGYVDIINGPQDWSACLGFSCQKRISNFYSIVATNMINEIHLSSTPPMHMRYRLNNNEGGNPLLLKMYFPTHQRIDIFVGDTYVTANNVALGSELFSMHPPDDKYIPSLSSLVEGENYYDPRTGYLYLLLRGTEPVEYKIQPTLVVKVGATVDIEEVVMDDVLQGMINILSIDPSNIRVSNVVRKGRKKRAFAPNWDSLEDIFIEFTIEPPPLTNLSGSVTVSGTPTMNKTQFSNVVSFLTNKFQAWDLGEFLGLNVTSMSTIEPIYEPTVVNMDVLDCIPQDEDPDGDCYLKPGDNAQTGTPWAEVYQANATAILQENLKETKLTKPTNLTILTAEPFQAWEKSPILAEIGLVDKDNVQVNYVGTEYDPWVVTASINYGPGDLSNKITQCKFVGSSCVFENLAVDKKGTNYTIKFELTHPNRTKIVGVTSQSFDVNGRQLSVKLTEFSTLNPEFQPIKAVVSMWDDGLDLPDKGADFPATSCDASLLEADGVQLEGTKTVSAINGRATFDDLMVTGEITGAKLQFSCSAGKHADSVTSAKFNVHPYPRTGNLKDAKTDFTFNGQSSDVQKVLAAFAKALAEDKGRDKESKTFQNESSEEEFSLQERIILSEEDFAIWPIID